MHNSRKLEELHAKSLVHFSGTEPTSTIQTNLTVMHWHSRAGASWGFTLPSPDSVFSIIYAKVLMDHMVESTAMGIGEKQCSFKNERSCSDHTFVVKQSSVH